MIVNLNLRNKILFKDLKSGSVFMDKWQDLYFKIEEVNTLTLSNGETITYNAVDITNGDLYYFIYDEIVYKVNGEFVEYEK